MIYVTAYLAVGAILALYFLNDFIAFIEEQAKTDREMKFHYENAGPTAVGLGFFFVTTIFWLPMLAKAAFQAVKS